MLSWLKEKKKNRDGKYEQQDNEKEIRRQDLKLSLGGWGWRVGGALFFHVNNTKVLQPLPLKKEHSWSQGQGKVNTKRVGGVGAKEVYAVCKGSMGCNL